MSSLANMKSQLAELEDQKSKLEAGVQKANQRLKISLLGLGVGVLLLRLSLWVGVAIIVIAVIAAIVFAVQQASFHDKLEALESEIHRLEISMA
jgi:hypothetical protein